jgi:hypothetical protein
MRDFADEIPGYLSNQAIKAMLMELPLKSGSSHLLNNMRICYEAMVNGRFIGDQELMLVNAWIQDMQDTWL